MLRVARLERCRCYLTRRAAPRAGRASMPIKMHCASARTCVHSVRQCSIRATRPLARSEAAARRQGPFAPRLYKRYGKCSTAWLRHLWSWPRRGDGTLFASMRGQRASTQRGVSLLAPTLAERWLRCFAGSNRDITLSTAALETRAIKAAIGALTLLAAVATGVGATPATRWSCSAPGAPGLEGPWLRVTGGDGRIGPVAGPRGDPDGLGRAGPHRLGAPSPGGATPPSGCRTESYM